MDEEKLKKAEALEFLEEGERILEKFNRDPELQKIQAPDLIYERLKRQIHEYEEFKSCIGHSREEKELIRLGKLYKKKRKQNRYLMLAAILILALGICISSMGGVDAAMRKMFFWLEGKGYIVLDESEDLVQQENDLSEEEALNRIEDAWGFYPVYFGFRPENIGFYEFAMMKAHNIAILTYRLGEEGYLFYEICPQYGTGAMGLVKDDACAGMYEIEVSGTAVTIAAFVEETTNAKSWDAYFTYKNVWYRLSFPNIEEAEVQKIVKNLRFN